MRMLIGVISDNDQNTRIFVAEGHNSVFRIAGAAITHHAKAIVQTEFGGWGNAFLHAPASDTTPPMVSGVFPRPDGKYFAVGNLYANMEPIVTELWENDG